MRTHYNVASSQLFDNAVKMAAQFKDAHIMIDATINDSYVYRIFATVRSY